MSDIPLATDMMVGIKLENGWQIVDRIEVDSDGTGGNFSVGFLAVNDDGQKGFVKAMDFGKILGTEKEQPLEILEFLVESFNYEKRLLTICGEHRMSRIVRLLDEGSIKIDQPDVKYPDVYYLICEVADGDVRKFINFSKEIDVAWRIRCLHQTSVGIQQLHNAQISHQDIKPSNVLMFEEGREAKLADLGRAVDRTADAPYEDEDISGDRTYAPPELLYGHIPSDWGARRLACDLYHLGSLGFFLFSGSHAVAALLGEVPPTHQPYRKHTHTDLYWEGAFEDVLPFLEEAFARNLSDLRKELPLSTTKVVVSGLIEVLSFLCAPDPSKRGHPRDRNTRTPYSVQRFVGSFNTLATQARIKALKGNT